nr:PREDICTED: bone morphogenetic protein receptor type-2-like [Latimeria chalumnae]|eukprot:XP_005991518.2 PREDICTED: bone morphogenetic protein receptor type-2-like [Latimeria chalumnae]
MSDVNPDCQSVRNAPNSEQHFSGLELTQLVDSGTYAEVWQGSWQGSPVAVKVFPTSSVRHYVNERKLYSLPLLRHDNITRFLEAEERIEGDHKKYLLVLEFYPLGSLRNYLYSNTSDWDTTLHQALSLTRGLAFLHSEVWNNGAYKPAIVHRDLSSENVLMKTSRICAICDLGFSMVVSNTGPMADGAKKLESSDIREVGTLHYMSPEILDGSLNLNNWKTALKQADVYSVGLILWEIFMRCTRLFQVVVVPCFKPAYENELKGNPTFAEMSQWVSEKRERPKIPEVWKENIQLYKCLKEILEDCWDQDAEARLTAQCTNDRLHRVMETL